MQLKPGTLLQSGKYTYTIGSVLGQGGFGITYQAMMKFPIEGPLGQIESEVKVAIKEFYMKSLCNRDETTRQVSVPSEGSRELVARFRKKFIKEAKCIASLRHPAIVKVIEIFEENGTAYYVMEYIEGGSMQEWVKQKGALPESEALGYIRQVASALAYIHGQKLNHLDIKPGNILRRAHGDVVLIDFGLSKQYDENGDQTSSTPVGVSSGYAPIEQSKPGGVGQFSAPTDIYSLGATLYKFVTAQTPPDASDVVSDGISLPPTVSKPVAQAIEKAMEPNRRNRPQCVNDFLKLLGEEEPKESLAFNEETKFQKEETKQEKKQKSACLEETLLVNEKNENHVLTVPADCQYLPFSVRGISFTMVYVEGGSFVMGATPEQGEDANEDEFPVHSVRLSDFYIGQTQVTQQLWEAVMGDNPSFYRGKQYAVEQVSWTDCQTFVERLNQLTGQKFRLPTEAEWEFAARGGTKSKHYKYVGTNRINDLIRHSEKPNLHTVGSILPNELGLWDMAGNIREWIFDWYGKYEKEEACTLIDPTGPAAGVYKVCRGDVGWYNEAAWNALSSFCRVSKRNYFTPNFTSFNLGFRLAMVP